MTRDRHDATPRQERDLTLGRALDELDVPDYPDDFLASVWERIDDEDAQRLETPAAKIAPGRRLRRLFARRPVALGLAAAIAAAVIIAVSLAGLPDGQQTPLGPQTAGAKLLSRIVYAMSRAHSLTGVVTESTFGAAGKLIDTRSGPFAVRDDGSWRLKLDDSAKGSTMGYDAAQHLAWHLDFDPRLPRHEWSAGIFRNSDGSELGGERLLVSGFAAGARAALAEGGHALEVKDVTYKGRPAWKAVIPARPPASPASSTEPGAPSAGSRPSAEVIVDQGTGLPVRVTQWDVGRAHTVWAMSHLRVDAALPTDAFAPAFPAGVSVHESDSGLRFLSLDQARHIVGFTVPTPTQVPDGFRLSDVFVHGGPAPAGSDQSAEPYAVVQEWRRGLDTFRVEVDAAGGSQSENDAFLAQAFAGAPASQSTKLHGGLFDGQTAFTALGPDPNNVSMGNTGPGLGIAGKGLLVTIFGDLTRQELLDAAASLKD